MIYFCAQLIGCIGFVIALFAYHKNKKNKILINMILSNIFYLIHYLMLNAYSGCLTKAVAICRDIFIVSKKSKLISNIFLTIFILIYIIIGIFTYNNVWSLFPILAALIYLIPVWNGNEIVIKKTAFVGYILWLIYNIFVLSIIGIISNIVSIISVFIAIKKNKN